MSNKVVICDLDGTLISVSSEVVFVRGLFKRGVLSFPLLWHFFCHYVRHPVRTVTEGRGWNRGYFSGLPVSVMMEEVEEDIPYLLNKVRPKVLDLLRAEQNQGAKICVLSASISPIVQSITKSLGFDCFRGSIPAVQNGKLTGHLIGQRPWGQAKVPPAIALLEQFRFAPDEALAIGDSWADRFVMQFCGDAVAVDPGRKLSKLAVEKGWRIIDPRK